VSWSFSHLRWPTVQDVEPLVELSVERVALILVPLFNRFERGDTQLLQVVALGLPVALGFSHKPSLDRNAARVSPEPRRSRFAMTFG
jgi:hypothetical protein